MTKDAESMTDYQLIRECLNGDNSYFEGLVLRYKNLVYSIILRMTQNGDEAADLSQDVFIKVYKNLDKYYPEYKFSTWIMRITANHVIDFRRKKRQDEISIEEANYDLEIGRAHV
jgi:RNA polymerase sigma-70 factor (ECF subfamily)